MSLRSSQQGVIIHKDNYLKIKGVTLNDEVNFITLQDKRKTKTQRNCFTAGHIIQLNQKSEDRFIDRLEEISQLKHELLTPYLGYIPNSQNLLVIPIIEGIYGDLKPSQRPVQVKDLEIRLLYDFITEISESDDKVAVNTQKSIFALCIANAMLYLHENNVVHQNLQLRTVKLAGNETNELPHLFYYGISEFENPKKAKFTAPELRNGRKNYSKATDVFAFGILLCQLYEEKRHTKEKPEILRSIDTPLGTLIKRCFDDDPAKRPTFEEIYDSFRRGDVLFPDTHKTKFDEVAKKLKEFDDKRFNIFFKSLTNNKSDFILTVYKYANKITPRNATNFFNIIGNYFTPHTNLNVFNALLTVSQKLVQNPSYCASFIEAELHLSLPFDQKELCQKSLNITYWIIQHQPDAIADISDVLIFLLGRVPEYTHKILVLLNIYQKKFDQIKNPCIFIDKVLVVLKNNKKLQFQTGFISIFYDLCKKFPSFRNKRLTYCIDAISSCIDSEKSSVIRAVYAFLAEYKDIIIPNKRRFYSFAPCHLVNPHTAIQTVKFLLIRGDYRITQKLITSAFRLATQSNYANLLLCKIADTEEGANLLMQPENMNFVEIGLPDYEGTLRILLILLRNRDYLEKYKQSKSLPFFVTQFCSCANCPRVITYLENLLFIINPNMDFIHELEANDFCSIFYSTVTRSKDDGIIENAMMIFGQFSLQCPTLAFLPILTDKLLGALTDKSSDRFKKAALFLLANLSAIKSCCKMFIENNFNPETKFKFLITKDSDLSRAVGIFKNNMSNYNQKKKAVALQKRAQMQSQLNTAQQNKQNRH